MTIFSKSCVPCQPLVYARLAFLASHSSCHTEATFCSSLRLAPSRNTTAFSIHVRILLQEKTQTSSLESLLLVVCKSSASQGVNSCMSWGDCSSEVSPGTILLPVLFTHYCHYHFNFLKYICAIGEASSNIAECETAEHRHAYWPLQLTSLL